MNKILFGLLAVVFVACGVAKPMDSQHKADTDYPLHVAAESGDYAELFRLIEAISSKDQLNLLGGSGTTFWGDTPLMVAVRRGHFDIVRLLVEAGASVNIHQLGQQEMPTAADIAVILEKKDFVEFLLNYGAVLSPFAADYFKNNGLTSGSKRKASSSIDFME